MIRIDYVPDETELAKPKDRRQGRRHMFVNPNHIVSVKPVCVDGCRMRLGRNAWTRVYSVDESAESLRARLEAS